MFRSLRVKILLFAVLAVSFVAGSLGWYFFRELKRQALSGASVSINLIHEKYHSQATAVLSRYGDLFETWSVIGERLGFAIMLNQFDEVRGDLVRYSESKLLSDSREPAFDSLLILDAEGNVLADSGQQRRGFASTRWDSHLKGVEGLKVQRLESLGVFVYILPLENGGERSGYLVGSTELSELDLLVKEYNEALEAVGFSGSLCFFEQQNLHLRNGESGFQIPPKAFNSEMTFVDNGDFFLTSGALEFPDGSAACMGSLINREVIFASIQRMLKISVTASLLVCILISALLSLFLNKLVIKPVHVLKAAAGEVEKGNLIRSLEIKSADEMGELADSFVRMSEGILQATEISEKLASNLENLPAPVFEVDADFYLTFVNKAYLKFVGCSSEKEVLGRKCTELLTIGSAKESGLEECVRAKMVVEKEFMAHVEAKDAVPVRITGRPLFDSQDAVCGALGFLVDMSETYNVAESVQKSAAHLSHIFDVLQLKTNEISERVGVLEERTSQVTDSSVRIMNGIDAVVSATEYSIASVTEVDSGMNKIARESSVALSSAQEGNNNLETVTGRISAISDSIASVTVAIEEMSSTFTEIERNTAKALDISKAATKQAQSASETMQRLNDVSNQVAKVLGVIGRIADQTNMLALNATIEAASAGDAGKGFGVVAAEVKELARQSAHSAEQIGEQLGIMQDETKSAVEAMQQVFEIVNELNLLNEANAMNIRAQSAVARDVANNMSRSSTNIRAIEEDALSTSELMKQILENMKSTDEVSRYIFEQSRAASARVHEIAGSSNSIAQDIAQSNENVTMAATATNGVREALGEANREVVSLKSQIAELGEAVKDFRLLGNV
jgi:PAS domain S-box-containing protein